MNLLQNFHLAVIEYVCRGRHAVPLSIVMALSTAFTQYATRKLPNLAK